MKDERLRQRAKDYLIEVVEYIKNNFKQIIKDSWWLWLLMAGAFCCGWWIAGAYYSNKCNAILIERGCDKIIQIIN